MPKKPTVKAHRGFIHIPRRGRGPRRPPRFPGFPGFPRFPGIGGPRRPQPYPFPGFPRRPRPYPPELIRDPRLKPPRGPIREPVRPPRGPVRPKRPTGDPRPEILRRQRKRDNRLPLMPTGISALNPRNRELLKKQLDESARKRSREYDRRQREQQRAADNFRRLRDAAFRRSTSAQRRAKGGAMVKSKDYVNPSFTTDRRKKK